MVYAKSDNGLYYKGDGGVEVGPLTGSLVTSVAGRTGAVVVGPADIASGTFPGSYTMTGNLTAGATLTLANPGVGNASTINFAKSSDSAGISVVETVSDQTWYGFTAADNPDANDAFAWQWTDWQNTGSGWTPLYMSGITTTFNAADITLNGRVNIPGGGFITSNGGIHGGRDWLRTTAPTKASGTGTITATVNAAGYTGGVTAMWVKLDSATTFSWGTGTNTNAATQTALAVGTGGVTTSNGVIVSFSAAVGGVTGDLWTFRVYPPTSLTAPSLAVTGLTGATSASRYVGATTTGAPASGTFVVGDYIIARDSAVWVCTAAGSPGTWTSVVASQVTLGTTQTITGNKTFTGTVVIGNKALWNGTRTITVTATDTVDLGSFSSTNGAMQLNIMCTVNGAAYSVSKTYEIDVASATGLASTWYKVLPQDATQNSGAAVDFALEVNRNATSNVYSFRIRQIGSTAGTLYFQAEGWGDNSVAFTPSTAVTAAPAAVSTIWSPTPIYTGPGRVGINNDAPAFELDVTGSVRSTTEFIGPAAGNVLKIGDDARLVDINIQHYSGIVSQTDATQGGWSFGNGATAFRILGNNGGSGTITGSVSVTGTTNSVGNLSENGNRVYSLGNKVPVAGLSATGTPNATTYLRGDNTWATVSGAPANMVTTDTTQTITGAKTFTAALYVNADSASTSPAVDVLNNATGQNIMRLSGPSAPSAFVVSNWGDLDLAGAVTSAAWLTAPYAQASATGYSRFVGGTNGAPTSAPVSVGSSFQTGDFSVDWAGVVWICTVGGNPGTWVNAAAGGATKRAFTMTLMGC